MEGFGSVFAKAFPGLSHLFIYLYSYIFICNLYQFNFIVPFF